MRGGGKERRSSRGGLARGPEGKMRVVVKPPSHEETTNTTRLWPLSSPISGQTSPAASSPTRSEDGESLHLVSPVPRESSESVLRSVAADDVDLIRTLVAGGRINRQTMERCLACAADHNSSGVLDFLLREPESGVNVNAQDELGTALHHALASNASEAVQVLMSAGACPLMVNDAGESPLAFCRRDANVYGALEAYTKRYALCKLRYIAWGLSELRSGTSDGRFRARMDAGAPLPRLTVKKSEEGDSDEVIAALKEMIVGVSEDNFDDVIAMMDMLLPSPVNHEEGESGGAANMSQDYQAESRAAAAAGGAEAAMSSQEDVETVEQQQPRPGQHASLPTHTMHWQPSPGVTANKSCLPDVEKGCLCSFTEKVWAVITMLCTGMYQVN